jgi:hypothetical protein
LRTLQRTFVGQPFRADFDCPICFKLGMPVRRESLTYTEFVQGALSKLIRNDVHRDPVKCSGEGHTREEKLNANRVIQLVEVNTAGCPSTC